MIPGSDLLGSLANGLILDREASGFFSAADAAEYRLDPNRRPSGFAGWISGYARRYVHPAGSELRRGVAALGVSVELYRTGEGAVRSVAREQRSHLRLEGEKAGGGIFEEISFEDVRSREIDVGDRGCLEHLQVCFPARSAVCRADAVFAAGRVVGRVSVVASDGADRDAQILGAAGRWRGESRTCSRRSCPRGPVGRPCEARPCDDCRRPPGATAFLVEKGGEGFSFGPPMRKMGQRVILSCEIFLEDVFLHHERRLGGGEGGAGREARGDRGGHVRDPASPGV